MSSLFVCLLQPLLLYPPLSFHLNNPLQLTGFYYPACREMIKKIYPLLDVNNSYICKSHHYHDFSSLVRFLQLLARHWISANVFIHLYSFPFSCIIHHIFCCSFTCKIYLKVMFEVDLILCPRDIPSIKIICLSF